MGGTLNFPPYLYAFLLKPKVAGKLQQIILPRNKEEGSPPGIICLSAHGFMLCWHVGRTFVHVSS